jgi:hypothetical protein
MENPKMDNDYPDTLESHETRLSHQCAVYIPVQQNESATVGLSATVQRVAKELCNAFGGATVQRVTGLWVNAAGQVIEDIIDRVYSFHNNESATDILRHIGLTVKVELSQESVLIEIDGQAILL